MFLISTATLLSGCPSASLKQDGLSAASMSSPQGLSATLFVEKENHGYKLKADINVVNDHAVRMDVNTSLDLPEASIILTQNKIEYLLYQQKKYYSGRPNSHALDPVFPMSIDADTLVKVLKEEKPVGSQCEQENGYLTQCTGKAGALNYRVTWSKRKDSGPLAGRASKMVIDIAEENISLRFYFSDWQKNVSNAERFLSLQVPPGFKTFSTPEH